MSLQKQCAGDRDTMTRTYWNDLLHYFKVFMMSIQIGFDVSGCRRIVFGQNRLRKENWITVKI